MGEPVSNRPLGAALKSDLDESRIATVKAAEQVDGVGHVVAGVPTHPLQEKSEVHMASRSVASDPSEVARGHADGQRLD
jgi:hypothetical protein